MVWTKEVPAEPGYYWINTKHTGTQIVRVRHNDGVYSGGSDRLMVVFFEEMDWISIEDIQNAAQWFGPLVEPEQGVA